MRNPSHEISLADMLLSQYLLEYLSTLAQDAPPEMLASVLSSPQARSRIASEFLAVQYPAMLEEQAGQSDDDDLLESASDI